MVFPDTYQSLQNLTTLHAASRYTCMHTPLFIFIQSELSLCIWQVLDHLCVMMSAVCVCSWVFCFLVQMKIFIILYDTRIAFAGNMTMTCSVVCVHNMYVNCV